MNIDYNKQVSIPTSKRTVPYTAVLIFGAIMGASTFDLIRSIVFPTKHTFDISVFHILPPPITPNRALICSIIPGLIVKNIYAVNIDVDFLADVKKEQNIYYAPSSVPPRCRNVKDDGVGCIDWKEAGEEGKTWDQILKTVNQQQLLPKFSIGEYRQEK